MGICCCKKKRNTFIENFDNNNDIHLIDKNNEIHSLKKNNENNLLDNNNEIHSLEKNNEIHLSKKINEIYPLDKNNEIKPLEKNEIHLSNNNNETHALDKNNDFNPLEKINEILPLDKNKEIHLEKKLNVKDFERIKLLGKGSFGEINLVKSKIDNKTYSMKIINKCLIRENEQRQLAQIEKNLLSKPSCSFIVNIKYVFQDEENLYILTDFIEGCDLSFQMNKGKKFKNENAKFYLIEIILAIEFLHRNNIIYRDLKPKKILLDNSGHIKLTNFGLSIIIKNPIGKLDTNKEFSEYLAPEIFSDLEYDSSVDWWSLGCIFYEMLIGRPPYKIKGESFNEEIYKKRILIPDYVTDEAEDLINKLLVVDSKKRLGSGIDGIKNIKQHLYFKDINWNDAMDRKLIPPFIPHND